MRRIKRFVSNCSQPRVTTMLFLTALWTAVVLLVPDGFVRTALSLLFLMLAPGYAVYRTIAGYPRNEPKGVVLGYVVGLSLISLMLIGLGVNQALLALGNQKPLTTFNLTVAVAAFAALLTLATAMRNRPKRRRPVPQLTLRFWRSQGRAFWLMVAAGAGLLVLPLLAVGGANILNNGGGNWLALSAVGLCAWVLFVLVWTDRKRLLALAPLGLYAVALSLLLGTSMRGWAITGHDVMQEFQVFQLTSVHSQWNMQFYQDAYTACLSITILPTLLQRLTGMYDPYIFKFVFQVLFALVAPLMYSALRLRVPKKVALLAVIVFVSFPTFLTDIMMLNRQEIALLCFTLAIAAGLDRQLGRVRRDILISIFLGGMVLAHYSTSYIAASTLLVAVFLGLALRLVVRHFKLRSAYLRQPMFAIIPTYIVVLTLVMIVGWSGFATHTANNIEQTITTIGADIGRIVTHTPLPSTRTPARSALDALDQAVAVIKNRVALPANDYYGSAITHSFTPTILPQTSADKASWLPVSAALLTKVYDLARQAYVGILALLLGLGLLVILVGRGASRLPIQYALFGAASLVVVVLQVVLPSGAVDYGLARVIQQALLVMALPAAVALVWLLAKLRIKRRRLKFPWRFRLAGVGLISIFLVLSGFLPTLSGGYKPVLAFSNSGFYYEAYYTHADEIAAGQWLVANTPKGSRVYADEFARRKLIAYTGVFAQPTLVPAGFPVDSYVYLSDGDLAFNEVPAYVNGNLIFYTTPKVFLGVHKNLLYNSGQVLIYK